MWANETRRLNEEVLEKLKSGDMIRFSAGCSVHWAVYAGKDEKDDAIIIHWCSNNAASSHRKQRNVASNPQIRIDSFWTFADTMRAEQESSDSIDGGKVVERAKALKQKLQKEEEKYKTYPDLFNSCEHFAKWCHYRLGVTPIKTEDISRVTNVWDFVHGIFTNHVSVGQAIRRNVGVLSQLKPGDVVRFYRSSYEHWATYIGRDKDKESFKSVIHWWDNDGAADPDITIVPFWELAENCTAEKISAGNAGKVALTEWVAYEDAKAWIEDSKTWCPDYVNCFHCSEDFAKFFYLKLMCIAEKKRRYFMPEVHCMGYQSLFCKHKDRGHVSGSRRILIEKVLMTLEINKLIQLSDYFSDAKERHYKKSEENREDLIMDLVCHFPWDPCSIFTRRKNDVILKTLKSGDLIEFVENSWNHWGVCIEVENGDGSFIHWTADDHAIEPSWMSDDCRPSIQIRRLMTLREADKLEKHNSDNHENTIIDGAQVVERIKAFEAQIKAGENNGEDYINLFNDCEQFAKWCRYGLGLKRLQMSTEDINKIKDVWMFVQGGFSVRPNEDIHTLRMLQLRKSKTAIGKNSGYVKSSRDIVEIVELKAALEPSMQAALEPSMLPNIVTWFLDILIELWWRSLGLEVTTEAGVGLIQSVLNSETT